MIASITLSSRRRGRGRGLHRIVTIVRSRPLQILLEYCFLGSVIWIYQLYLQSTIEFPSNNESLIFGQHQLHSRTFSKPQIKNNPKAQIWLALGSLETRLGNNMFQYAAIIGIMARYNGPNNLKLCVHPHSPLHLLEETFVGPLQLNKCSDVVLSSMEDIPEWGYATFQDFVIPPCPGKLCAFTIKGYFQSFKYFQDCCSRTIHSIYTFKTEIEQKAVATMKSSSSPIKVGIHVRKGDMKKQGFYLRDPPMSYYQNAMEYFTDLYGSIQYIVASDDPDWVEQQPLFQGSTILRNNNAPVDFAILASCHHVIMSRGTFGWWAAWLSGGKAIYYKHTFVMEHDENRGKVKLEDYFLPTWVSMDA